MMKLLVRTNNDLVQQLNEKDNRVETLNQKYIMVLEKVYKMQEMSKKKDAEILDLKNQIQDMKNEHVCDDLIDLNNV